MVHRHSFGERCARQLAFLIRSHFSVPPPQWNPFCRRFYASHFCHLCYDWRQNGQRCYALQKHLVGHFPSHTAHAPLTGFQEPLDSYPSGHSQRNREIRTEMPQMECSDEPDSVARYHYLSPILHQDGLGFRPLRLRRYLSIRYNGPSP